MVEKTGYYASTEYIVDVHDTFLHCPFYFFPSSFLSKKFSELNITMTCLNHNFFLKVKFMNLQDKSPFWGVHSLRIGCCTWSVSQRQCFQNRTPKLFSLNEGRRAGQALTLGMLWSWKWRDHPPHLFVLTFRGNEMHALQTKYLLKIKGSILPPTPCSGLPLFLLPCPFESIL